MAGNVLDAAATVEVATELDSPPGHDSHRAGAREIGAVLLLVIPFVVVALTAILWVEWLPADLPRQWNADGVSGTSPLWLMLVGPLLLTLLAAIGAAFALPAAAAPNRVCIFLAAGFVGGAAAGAWLLCAGLALAPGSADVTQADVGGWPLLMVLFWGYGALPAFLAYGSGPDRYEACAF